MSISLGEDEMATLDALAKSVHSNVSLVCTRRRNAEDLRSRVSTIKL